ncbi:hypothetical protein Ahy_A10g048800 [Arachis hypogaea]|uniref:Transposase MuDR plant domain-containing protein n=1 Tax=Arachis hypogaea TaxID=3818 RepID=A0A445B610_ARAHY|nr:hypothetical protein Ahy_A10g048800 [Arachis hypogaea]
MSINLLLFIHCDGEIVYDEECSIVFRYGQPIITYMIPKVNSLTALKNLILHTVGQQQTKRIKKIYYRYPTEIDDNLFYKRNVTVGLALLYRLCDDEDVRLIRSWDNRWTNVHLLELFVFLVELGGRGSFADTVDDSPLSGAVGWNIRRTMVDLNMPAEVVKRGLTLKLYEVNPDDGDDADDEPTELLDDGDEEEEMNYCGDTQIFLTQPAISRPYDRPDHFSRLNLDAMIWIGLKRYNIRRAEEYKIVASDQLRYNVHSGPVVLGAYSYHIAESKKKWEVRRYTGPYTCMQTSIGARHRRLDSNVIAQHIFTMVKADPTISIRVLQRGVENHFDYKASFRKV